MPPTTLKRRTPVAAFPTDLARQTHYFWSHELMVVPKKLAWAVYRAIHPDHPKFAVRGGKLVG